MMLSVDFGNPLWVERAMQSAKLMKEIWMGVNQRGHPQAPTRLAAVDRDRAQEFA